MTRAHRFLFLTIMLALTVKVTVAQVQTGTPPFGSFGGGPDVINLGNLNAHLTIPVLHKPGRGTNFSYDLAYDSSVWYPVTSGSTTSWQPVANWGWGIVSQPVAGLVTYTVTPRTCTDRISYYGNYNQYSNWTFIDSFGTAHPTSIIVSDESVAAPPCTSPRPLPYSSGPIALTDGSGYTLSVTADPAATLTTASGTTLYPNVNYSSTGTATDRNGNQISVSTGVFTDTLGTTALTVAGVAPSNTTFTYTAPSTANASYTMIYTIYSIQTNFGCGGTVTDYGTNGNMTANLVSEIHLPDWNATTNPNSKYTFTYEPTYGHSGFVTGRLASVTLPTGGTISYQYSTGGTGVNGISCSDGSATTVVRTTPDGTWMYTRTQVSGSHWQTTITDPTTPTANQTVIDFQKDSSANPTQNFYETQRKVYQGSTSGTLLRQWITCYNGNTTNCTTAAVSSPITQRNITDQYGSSGLQCQHNYYYNSVGGLSEQDDYDYGSGGPGALLRKTIITYASLPPNITAFQQTVTICNGTGSSSSCAGPSGGSIGTVVSQTNYNYDEPNTLTATSGIAQHTSVSGSRGNLTSINYPVSGLTSHFTYYDTGSPNTSQDVNGATTTYNYSSNTADCQMAFPTSVSEPLSMSKSFAWNCTGGVMTQLTDENNQSVSTNYNDPYFWRPSSATDKANITTNICYAALTSTGCPSTPSATQIETYLNFNSNNSTVDKLTTLDGLGRVHVQQTRQGPYASNSNFDSVETDCDALGRVSRVTLPYSGTAGQTNPSAPATTTTYDALSRVYQVKDGGNGTATYTYSSSSNDVLVAISPAPSGENLKQRQFEYNSLGWLTSVCELTSGTTAWPGGTCQQNLSQTGYWTKYAYDVLGDLLTVTQNAQATSGNQQTRTYTFDALGRLTSEKNPETNQVATSYTYDSDTTCTPASSGDLVKRIDPVGNTTCYTYDALHRITSVTYPSGAYASSTPAKTFVYDSATVSGVSMTNVKGRIAEAYTGPSSAKTTDLGFSYTPRGEVSDVYQLTPHSNSSYYHISQTYWQHGAPSQLSSGISGLPMISYGGTIGSTVGLDGEGRITQVTASGTGQQNPVTGVSYNNSSLPTQVNFGSGDSDIFAYDSNTLRMTQFKFNIGTQSQSLTGALTWNANSTLGQLGITDQFNSADTQTCNYSHDDLVRIVSANCGTAAAQTFSYDPFGNISKSGSPYSFQPTYSVTTNRFASLPGNFTPTYDANGNVTNDSNHTYSWDADGNSITIDTIGLTFDAFDRMVEQNRSGTYTEIVYAPTGDKLALMSGTGGQTLQKALILLPGRDTAIYTSSGLDHYRHSDWLGSARLTSTASRTASSTIAYAPFGETYAQSGTTDPSFTGQNADTVSTDYDFVSREYSNEGRWPSPDPAGLGAAHSMNPQSWNRYAYVLNNPLSLVDPFGLDCIYLSDDETSYYIQPGECSGGDNGYYVDGTATVTANSFNADGQLVSVSVNGSDQGVGSVSDYSVTVNDSDPGPEVSSYAQEIGRELAPLNRASDFVGCTLVSAVVGDGGLPPPVTHILFEGASKALENPKAATLAARAYYTATDARFTAFGKFSKVLVPRMAASLRPVLITAGETVSVAGWVVLGYEVYRAGSRCAKTN